MVRVLAQDFIRNLQRKVRIPAGFPGRCINTTFYKADISPVTALFFERRSEVSGIVITPELTLQIQNAANEVGLTESEINRLFDPEALSVILPFLLGKSKISPYCPFFVWQEIKVSSRIKTGADLVSALQGIGVRVGGLGYLPLEALQKPEKDDEVYEIFCVDLGDLGLGNKSDYKIVEKRARVLEIHDGTAPPTLAAELLLKSVITSSKKDYRYRVFSRPAPATELLGEVVFAIENGFPEDEQDGRSFTREDPVCIPVPHNFDEDVIYSEQKLIFSRRRDGLLGHEPLPPRAGMWPVSLNKGRYLPRS